LGGGVAKHAGALIYVRKDGALGERDVNAAAGEVAVANAIIRLRQKQIAGVVREMAEVSECDERHIGPVRSRNIGGVLRGKRKGVGVRKGIDVEIIIGVNRIGKRNV